MKDATVKMKDATVEMKDTTSDIIATNNSSTCCYHLMASQPMEGILKDKFRIYLLYSIASRGTDSDKTGVVEDTNNAPNYTGVDVTVQCRIVIHEVPIQSTVESFIVPFAKQLLRQRTEAMADFATLPRVAWNHGCCETTARSATRKQAPQGEPTIGTPGPESTTEE
jgi:hypothetical protein